MSRGNGLVLPGAVPQQPMVQVASPINDIQLVAQLAATLCASRPELSAVDAITFAQSLVVEAMKRNDELGRQLMQAR